MPRACGSRKAGHIVLGKEMARDLLSSFECGDVWPTVGRMNRGASAPPISAPRHTSAVVAISPAISPILSSPAASCATWPWHPSRSRGSDAPPPRPGARALRRLPGPSSILIAVTAVIGLDPSDAAMFLMKESAVTREAMKVDERHCVEVRVAVPPGGFGSQLDVIERWLNANLGPDGYSFGADWSSGRKKIVAVYFVDVAGARAFIGRFACAALIPNGQRVTAPAHQRFLVNYPRGTTG